MSTVTAEKPAAEPTFAAVGPAPERPLSAKARTLIARSRYEAPSVASFTISGCDPSGILSMVGNVGPS